MIQRHVRLEDAHDNQLHESRRDFNRFNSLLSDVALPPSSLSLVFLFPSSSTPSSIQLLSCRIALPLQLLSVSNSVLRRDPRFVHKPGTDFGSNSIVKTNPTSNAISNIASHCAFNHGSNPTSNSVLNFASNSTFNFASNFNSRSTLDPIPRPSLSSDSTPISLSKTKPNL